MIGSVGVALCRRVPIAELFAPAFRRAGSTLLHPSEVSDPEAVRFALCFLPDDNAFAPYENLMLAASIGAGADGIIRCPSLSPQVPVVRVEDADQANQMAGFALFHILYWHRRFDRLLEAQQEARWARARSGRSPKGVVVGVMGLGFIGRRVAEVCRQLGYAVVTLSRSTPQTPMDGVRHMTLDALYGFARQCDIVVGLLPDTPQTKGMLDADFFAAMKPGTALIQLGRGGQVVEADLVAALDGGHLAGASLDVFAAEPLPQDSPLWHHRHILVTPHTAAEATTDAVVATVENAFAALMQQQRPRGLVDRDKGY
ncbi:MAG: NAD(P)-dependent oxidoreductase [Pseudomonadota bacterium]